MKIRSYRMLFRFFSYLSDKTNGASFFVNYKLLLGTLLIGLTGVSCSKSKQTVSCYDITPVDSVLIQTVKKESIDSIKKDSSQKVIQIRTIRPTVLPPQEPVSCYVIIPPLPEDTTTTIVSEEKLEEPQN